jgi:WD40 repeat protein
MEYTFVDALVFGHAGGRPVVACCTAREGVDIWDARTGALIQTLSGYDDWIRTVALGEIDGRSVIATDGRDTKTCVQDALTGERLLELKGHSGSVCAVALGEVDGHAVVVTGSQDRTVRVWDARTGQQQVAFFLGGSVQQLALAASRLAIASDRGLLMLEHREPARTSDRS